MKMADEGYGNSVREKLSIGENVRTFWYRTDENGAYTEITVNENFENFTAAIEQDNDYLELTDVDPDQPESETYDLWVAGTQVTETNQNDVLGNGTVSYDPAAHTLTLKQADHFAVTVTMLTAQDDFSASGAKVTRHRWNGGGFALVRKGDVARVVDQFGRAAYRTFHGHSSLKETINTSSMTVSFRYTSPFAVSARYTSCQIR